MATNKNLMFKIRYFERELERIKNGGFPLPYEAFDHTDLTDESKATIIKFAEWLSENQIALEILSVWDSGFIFSIFKRQSENMKLSRKQKEKLQEMTNRSVIAYKKDQQQKELKLIKGE